MSTPDRPFIRPAEQNNRTPHETEKRATFQHFLIQRNPPNQNRFAINPHSFGQSVENLFYISFLVRDGAAEVRLDTSGVPSLRTYPFPTVGKTEGAPCVTVRIPTNHTRRADIHDKTPNADTNDSGAEKEKRQSVFSLDFETWTDIIEVFGCEGDGLIGMRDEGGLGSVGVGGWYG